MAVNGAFITPAITPAIPTNVKAAIEKIEEAVNTVNDVVHGAIAIVDALEEAIEKLNSDVFAGLESVKAIAEEMKALVADIINAFAQFEDGFKDLAGALDMNGALSSDIEALNKHVAEKIEED